MRNSWVMGLLVTALSGAASADDAENAAAYRHDVMEAIGAHMHGIVAIAKQEVPHQDHLAVLAGNMAGLSKLAPDVFPEGSDVADSEALEEIWTEPAEFAERLEAFRSAAVDLDAVVNGGDMSGFGDALNGLGQACKACHDRFKEE